MDQENTHRDCDSPTDPSIDFECERAMITFVHYHKAARMANLNTIWREFLRIYPCPNVSDSELKWHYIRMDRTENRWDVDEEKFLYFKYGADIEDFEEFDDEDSAVDLADQDQQSSSRKLLVTFDRKQSVNTGLTQEGYKLYIEAFRDQIE